MIVRAEPPSTKDCTNAGVVITVSNPPNEPLAMGNYDLVVSARVRRSK